MMDPQLQSLLANVAMALSILFGVVILIVLLSNILDKKKGPIPWFVLIGFAVSLAVWLTLRT